MDMKSVCVHTQMTDLFVYVVFLTMEFLPPHHILSVTFQDINKLEDTGKAEIIIKV